MVERKKLVPIDRTRLETVLASKPLLTQAILAKRAGITDKKLSALLTGRNHKLPQEKRATLARALGVNVGFLRGDPDAPAPGLAAEMHQSLPGFPALRAEREMPSTGSDLEVGSLMQMLDAVAPVAGHDRALVTSAVNWAMQLHMWRSAVNGSDVGHGFAVVRKREEKRFAALMSELAWLVLKPWITPETRKIPQPGRHFGEQLLEVLLKANGATHPRLWAQLEEVVIDADYDNPVVETRKLPVFTTPHLDHA